MRAAGRPDAGAARVARVGTGPAPHAGAGRRRDPRDSDGRGGAGQARQHSGWIWGKATVQWERRAAVALEMLRRDGAALLRVLRSAMQVTWLWRGGPGPERLLAMAKGVGTRACVSLSPSLSSFPLSIPPSLPPSLSFSLSLPSLVWSTL